MFFGHRFSPAFATLVGNSGFVENAIQAGAKIFVAAVATFTASGLVVERPFLSAFVTIPCYGVGSFTRRLAKRF